LKDHPGGPVSPRVNWHVHALSHMLPDNIVITSVSYVVRVTLVRKSDATDVRIVDAHHNKVLRADH
jgi:hypothetical protein